MIYKRKKEANYINFQLFFGNLFMGYTVAVSVTFTYEL